MQRVECRVQRVQGAALSVCHVCGTSQWQVTALSVRLPAANGRGTAQCGITRWAPRRAVPCWTCFTLHTSSTHTHPRLQYCTFCLLTISPPLSPSLYVTEVRFAFDSLLQQRRGIPSNEYLLMIRIVHFALCSFCFIDLIRTQQQTKSCLSLSPQYLSFISLFILSYLLFLKRKWMMYNWLQEKMNIYILKQRMAQHLCNARRNKTQY